MSNLLKKLNESVEKEQSKHPIMSLRKAYIHEIIPSFILIFIYILKIILISNTIAGDILTIVLCLAGTGLCMYILHIEIDFKKEVQDELVQETFNKMRKSTINIINGLAYILIIICMFLREITIPSFTITPDLILGIMFLINAIWKTVFLILDKNEIILEDEE